MVDPIARAYATIGVPRGASARELKRQYKRLVRQWHPDRWTNDPAGQAEASSRMRVINAAYATLEHLGPAAPPPVNRPRAAPHRPLSKEELDAIVQAIGTESPVTSAVWVAMGALLIGGAFLMIQPLRGIDGFLAGPSSGQLLMAAIFFMVGIAVLIFRNR